MRRCPPPAPRPLRALPASVSVTTRWLRHPISRRCSGNHPPPSLAPYSACDKRCQLSCRTGRPTGKPRTIGQSHYRRRWQQWLPAGPGSRRTHFQPWLCALALPPTVIVAALPCPPVPISSAPLRYWGWHRGSAARQVQGAEATSQLGPQSALHTGRATRSSHARRTEKHGSRRSSVEATHGRQVSPPADSAASTSTPAVPPQRPPGSPGTRPRPGWLCGRPLSRASGAAVVLASSSARRPAARRARWTSWP